MRLPHRAIPISLVLLAGAFVGSIALLSIHAAQARPAPVSGQHQDSQGGAAVGFDRGAAKAPSPAPQPPVNDGLFVDVSVDYGAQLLLTDSQGRKTGYDPATAQMLSGIPGVSYSDDTITDATDDSSNPAVAESRVLEIHPAVLGRYSLKVSPTDRDSYNIEFFCGAGKGREANISAQNLGIAPGEEHSFNLAIATGCSGGLVSGAFVGHGASEPALLTFGYPNSDHIHLTGSSVFHLVIVYDRRLNPSSFAATLNGNTIASLFHPQPNAIESVTVPLTRGRNLVQLSASGASKRGSSLTTTDSFVVEVE